MRIGELLAKMQDRWELEFAKSMERRAALQLAEAQLEKAGEKKEILRMLAEAIEDVPDPEDE